MMMQDWADRLDLLERGEVKAASERLIVYVHGFSRKSNASPSVNSHTSSFANAFPDQATLSLPMAWGLGNECRIYVDATDLK